MPPGRVEDRRGDDRPVDPSSTAPPLILRRRPELGPVTSRDTCHACTFRPVRPTEPNADQACDPVASVAVTGQTLAVAALTSASWLAQCRGAAVVVGDPTCGSSRAARLVPGRSCDRRRASAPGRRRRGWWTARLRGTGRHRLLSTSRAAGVRSRPRGYSGHAASSRAAPSGQMMVTGMPRLRASATTSAVPP